MKVISIVGARPQFIKAAVVSKAIRKKKQIFEKIIHTGQHFDENMSDVFFNQLELPNPDYQLNINGLSHGEMTGKMLYELERIFQLEKPDYIIVYGDTNSTLSGALAAVKLNIPVIHVEAGLRSFNMSMPEEINRILTDRISKVLFCPSEQAVLNLKNEGYENQNVDIILTGDVMLDAMLALKDVANKPENVKTSENFILATCHRQENTDDPSALKNIINAMNQVHQDVATVFCPLHPRTLKKIRDQKIDIKFIQLEPLGYLEMLWLLKNCSLVLTDSGGLQKEAFFMGKYCITLREQTEWIELVEEQVNTLVGHDTQKIIYAVKENYGKKIENSRQFYGNGRSSEVIASYISELKKD